DGTAKTARFDGFRRPWPNPIVMDEETIKRVNNRWHEYNTGVLLDSPSAGFMKLTRGKGAVAFKNDTH
ncbi:MAG TPA: hypothetical protein VE870_07990, partial [Bacteroidales bacterium]|nr:hypothetical protein [Bacteroidales bacterium]